jgi:chromosome partitioning protein
MAHILTIAQHKGGAGKTTLSTQIAAGLHEQDQKVLLLDLDPQGSSREWFDAREKTLGRKNKIDCQSFQGWKLIRELSHLKSRYDWIVIDTPPHAESETSIAIRNADLVLIPIQPSPLDVWASGPVLQLTINERKPLMLVMNRVPPKSKLNDVIMDKLSTMGIAVARQSLGNRISFASSIMQGLGVVESDKNSVAAEEIRALIQDIRKHKIFKSPRAA